jgi:hypothetical protein
MKIRKSFEHPLISLAFLWVSQHELANVSHVQVGYNVLEVCVDVLMMRDVHLFLSFPTLYEFPSSLLYLSRRSAEEILVLLEDESQAFDFVNLVTALHRIAKTTGSRYSNDPRL